MRVDGRGWENVLRDLVCVRGAGSGYVLHAMPLWRVPLLSVVGDICTLEQVQVVCHDCEFHHCEPPLCTLYHLVLRYSEGGCRTAVSIGSASYIAEGEAVSSVLSSGTSMLSVRITAIILIVVSGAE